MSRLSRACAASCLSLVVLVALSLLPSSASARTWYVKVDGTGDVPRLQDAADLAQPGDTVLVGPGRYTYTNQGPGNEQNHGLWVLWADRPRGVTFISEEGPENTILDAEGQTRTVFINGNNRPEFPVVFTFSGFTIANGNARPAPPEPFTQGGGMALHLVYPIIENCIFVNNYAETGGGVFAGGVSSILFRNCTFIDNRSYVGAGMLVLHSFEKTTIENCTFIDNVSVRTEAGGGGWGAGLGCYNNNYEVRGCTFIGNDAELTGAAFYSLNSKPGILVNNTFVGNITPEEGEAVYHKVTDQFDGYSDIEFHNNIIAYNDPSRALTIFADVNFNLSCNNLFANAGGDWEANLLPYLGSDGNVREDPMFCAEDRLFRHVDESSMMLGKNNGCGDIGATIDGGHDCSALSVGHGGEEPPVVEPATTVPRFRVSRATPNPFLPLAGNGMTVRLYPGRRRAVDSRFIPQEFSCCL